MKTIFFLCLLSATILAVKCEETNRPIRCPGFTGYVADPENSEKYYMCLFYHPFERSCGFGKYYDIESNTCKIYIARQGPPVVTTRFPTAPPIVTTPGTGESDATTIDGLPTPSVVTTSTARPTPPLETTQGDLPTPSVVTTSTARPTPPLVTDDAVTTRPTPPLVTGTPDIPTPPLVTFTTPDITPPLSTTPAPIVTPPLSTTTPAGPPVSTTPGGPVNPPVSSTPEGPVNPPVSTTPGGPVDPPVSTTPGGPVDPPVSTTPDGPVDPPLSTTTTTTTTQGPGCPVCPPIVCPATGIHRYNHSTFCHRFYLCVEGVFYEMTCPPGQNFDYIDLMCRDDGRCAASGWLDL